MKEWSASQPGVYPGEDREPRLQDTPQSARVVDVSTKGVRVELLVERGVLYGPARWSLGAYATPAAAITAGHYPHPGDAALIVFAGAGIGDPWVVAWWR